MSKVYFVVKVEGNYSCPWVAPERRPVYASIDFDAAVARGVELASHAIDEETADHYSLYVLEIDDEVLQAF
jgi:hypothetical protein